MESPAWTLALAKEDFKFSVAHFTLFDPESAETLHGHNYRVEIELTGAELDAAGLLVDVDELKRAARALCARLDDRVLLPEASPWLEIRRDGGDVVCRFGPRTYRFPAGEVALLPLANTSMELLARWFWEGLAPGLPAGRVTRLAVAVEETSGQACRYAAPVG